MMEQASTLLSRRAFMQYSCSPSWQKREQSSDVFGWNQPKALTASSSVVLFINSTSKMGAYSRWKATKSGCVSGSAKLRRLIPALKLYADLLARQQGNSMGWRAFLVGGFSRYSWQLLSLASTVLISHPMVLENSSSIFSSRGITSLNSSKSIFSSSEGALRNSFWISKEGQSKVFSRSSNSTSSSPWKGALDSKRGTFAVKGTDISQCQRTALSRQPGFTGGGNTVEILQYSVHLKRTIFQNCCVSSVSPNTRLRQSSAKAQYRFCPSAFRSPISAMYSLVLRVAWLRSMAQSARSARACRNSFLMVLASTSASTISRMQGSVVFSQMRWRQRTLMPISCSVVLMEQLSTNMSSILSRRSSSSGIQQVSISLLASITLLSSVRLKSSVAEECRKACESSCEVSSLVQSRQKATISGRRRASGMRVVFWALQSTGKRRPGLMRQQKFGRIAWSCVLSFLKWYSYILSVLPSGASTFRLAYTSKGSLLTFSTSSTTSRASLSLLMNCRSPSLARRLQTSVFSSSEKGMSHMRSSLTPLQVTKDMRGRRNLQPRTSRSVKRMSLMLQLTMNNWFSSFPPRRTHSPLQQLHPSTSRVPSPNPTTTSSTQLSAMRRAALLKNYTSLSRPNSRSILSARGALGSTLMASSKYLKQSRQKEEMEKFSWTSWFLALTISAISFSFFFRCRIRSSSAISAFVFSRFFVFWIDSTYSSIFCSCSSSVSLPRTGVSLGEGGASLGSLGDGGVILARVRRCSRYCSRCASMNSLTSKGNSKSHFSICSSCVARPYSPSSSSAADSWSVALTIIFLSGKTISRKVFLILLRGRKLISWMKSSRTAALKYLRFSDSGSCSTNPGCRLQYSRKPSCTCRMRSLDVHPSLLSFLHTFGFPRHSSDISSAISSGNVRLSLRMPLDYKATAPSITNQHLRQAATELTTSIAPFPISAAWRQPH